MVKRPRDRAFFEERALPSGVLGFDEQGLEQAFVGLDLALKFVVFFWTEAGLVRMRDYLIDIDFRPVSPENSAIEPALLKAYNMRPLRSGVWVGHDL
jgi:hypothetical protein